MSLAKFTARSLLSAIFITGGLDEIKKADQLSEAVDGLLSKLPKSSCSQIPDVDSTLLVNVNGATMLAACSLLAPQVHALYAPEPSLRVRFNTILHEISSQSLRCSYF